jgi:hypothetical protein
MTSAVSRGILHLTQPVMTWLAERRLLLLNHSVLFLCASIYLGTGVSLVFFQLPSFAELTVDNYYEYLVPPVDRATAFFTYMTMVMYVTAGLMLLAERATRLRWAPVVVLLALTASTLLTVLVVFDYNERLRAGIGDQAELETVVAAWAVLNWVRASLWLAMWLAVMTYFAVRADPAIRAGQ